MKTQIGYTIFFVLIVVANWAIRTHPASDAIAQTRVSTSVTDLAQPMIESKAVAGLSIGIVTLDPEGNLVSETQHFGYATSLKSAEAQSPTDRTLYEVGGLSNVFTGILLASAVERGEVTLKTDAADLMPPGVTMPSHGDQKITLLELVTHRSGLPRLATNMPFSKPNDPYCDYTSELAGEFLNQRKLLRAPGTQYEYSNFGMSYLGFLLTRQSGAESYDVMLQDRLTGPLGMSSTKVGIDDSSSNLAVGHTEQGLEAVPWHCADMPGAGGIRSNIVDMNRFMMATLKPTDDLAGKSIDLAFQKHVNPLGREFAMGLGWSIARDGQTRFRNGQTGGYSAAIFINRQLNLGVCVLANSACNDITALAEQLVQMKAGMAVTAPSAEKSLQVKTDIMDRYVGRYQLAPQFIFDVRRDGTRLMVGVTNQPTTQVYARTETEWFYKEVEASLVFDDIKDGKAQALTLAQLGRRQKASRIGDRDGAGYPKLSPFAGVRWRGEFAEVEVDGTWYELVSLNGISFAEIIAFSRLTFGNSAKQCFEEDLVELLTRMDHAPNAEVKLVLKSLTDNTTTTLEKVAMTRANRQAIYAAEAGGDE